MSVVDVREWDGGDFLVSTMGRGGRRHAPKGAFNKAGYEDPTKVRIMGVDELAVISAAQSLRPNAAAPSAEPQAQILFDTRASRFDSPREMVLIVKLTPAYAVAWRGLVDHSSGPQVDYVFTRLRSGSLADYESARFILRYAGHTETSEILEMATPFRPDAPAGSFDYLKRAAIAKLGKTVDLRAVLGPEGAREYEEQRAGLDMLDDLNLTP